MLEVAPPWRRCVALLSVVAGIGSLGCSEDHRCDHASCGADAASGGSSAGGGDGSGGTGTVGGSSGSSARASAGGTGAGGGSGASGAGAVGGSGSGSGGNAEAGGARATGGAGVTPPDAAVPDASRDAGDASYSGAAGKGGTTAGSGGAGSGGTASAGGADAGNGSDAGPLIYQLTVATPDGTTSGHVDCSASGGPTGDLFPSIACYGTNCSGEIASVTFPRKPACAVEVFIYAKQGTGYPSYTLYGNLPLQCENLPSGPPYGIRCTGSTK